MDDILELPNADVSKLQERGQSEGPEDGDSSADEEEGGLDWTKLPYVFSCTPIAYHSIPALGWQAWTLRLSSGHSKAWRKRV